MATDEYEYNGGPFGTLVSNLRSDISDYEEQVKAIEDFIKGIETSESWVDMNVKSAFISTCDTYTTSFYALSKAMNVYLTYLQASGDGAETIESNYAG